jgi:pyridoxamine 5'-phosphate oxidase
VTKNNPHPIETFHSWFQNAKNHKEIIDPTAVNLATASKEGKPANRMVLLKDYSEKGFVFYTHINSHKGKHLCENPYAAMCFHWPALKQQIRIEGAIQTVSDQEADAYFASRPLQSQIGAWASQQSEVLEHPAALAQNIASYTSRFLGKSIPRPPHWSGFILVPHTIEFWEEGPFRIHKRIRFSKNKHNIWQSHKLYP